MSCPQAPPIHQANPNQAAIPREYRQNGLDACQIGKWRRRRRSRTTSHDPRMLPATAHGRYSQKLCPLRADIGSRGVATWTWWT